MLEYPSCEQNHRHLYKHNLAPTSLWVVTSANLFSLLSKMSTLPTLCNQWDVYRLLQWPLESLCPLLQTPPPFTETPFTATPRTEIPLTKTLDRDPLDRDPLRQRPLLDTDPFPYAETPQKEHGTRQQDKKRHNTETPSPFAGGNYEIRN